MKNIFILLFLNLTAVLVQTNFLPELVGKLLVPNLVFAVGAYFTLTDRYQLGLRSVFIGGLLIDAISYGQLGLSSFVMVLSLYLLFLFRKYVFKGFLFNTLVVVFLSVVYSKIIVFRDTPLNIEGIVGAILTTIIALLMIVLIKYEKKSY